MTRSRRRKLERLRARWAGIPIATTLLGGGTLAHAEAVANAAGDAALEEVVVTAQKRSENLQNVPISVLALDGKRLEELGVRSFNDVAKYLPSLSFQTYGPGQAQVYFRGITNGSDGLKVGSSAMVGVYLDELPVTTIGSSLDVHVYDMARIEALAGPQGTLFGASSMAGTVRYITNRPDVAGNYGGYDLSLTRTAHGGAGGMLEGFVNVALGERAAIRLVGWGERDPGYIDNVAGPAEIYPTSGVVRDNAAYRASAYNDVGTAGARAALKIDLDDRWTITPSVNYQKQGANGSFGYEPFLGDLNVATYGPMRNDDRWYQAALTVEGKIANLDLTYSGGYLRRTIDNHADYSDYSFAYDVAYADQPAYFGDYFQNDAGQHISPSQNLVSQDLLGKRTHELRLASPATDRLRFVIGAFYQEQRDDNQYRYLVTDLGSAYSITGQPGVHYQSTINRRDVDRALFTDISYDLSGKLALTGGIRVFDYRSTAAGFFGFNGNYSVGESLCSVAPTPATVTAIQPCENVNARAAGGKHTEKLTLNYRFDPDRLVYATWSTGFRQGGINRSPVAPPYKPDYLANYELGWKTSWAAHTVRFNGAVFVEDWKDAQFGVEGDYAITQIVNAGGARTEGVESSLDWLLSDGLTLSLSGSYLWKHALTQAACYAPSAAADCGSADNLAAPSGTPMPVSPPLKANATLRYEFRAGGLAAHVQAAGVYQSAARSLLATADEAVLGEMPAHGSLDLSAGIGANGWSAALSIENALDSRGQVSRYLICSSAYCQIPYVVPIRPRTLSLQFGQKF